MNISSKKANAKNLNGIISIFPTEFESPKSWHKAIVEN